MRNKIKSRAEHWEKLRSVPSVAIVALGLAIATQNVIAATYTQVTLVETGDLIAGGYTQAGQLPQKIQGQEVDGWAHWFSDADDVWVIDPFPDNTDPNVGSDPATWIEYNYGLVPDSLVLEKEVSYNPTPYGLSETFDDAVYFVSMKYDGVDVIFHYSSGITNFGFEFVTGNTAPFTQLSEGYAISNIKGYSGDGGGGPPAVIPIPAAAPLFASAIGLFGFAGWRKRQSKSAK